MRMLISSLLSKGPFFGSCSSFVLLLTRYRAFRMSSQIPYSFVLVTISTTLSDYSDSGPCFLIWKALIVRLVFRRCRPSRFERVPLFSYGPLFSVTARCTGIIMPERLLAHVIYGLLSSQSTVFLLGSPFFVFQLDVFLATMLSVCRVSPYSSWSQ